MRSSPAPSTSCAGDCATVDCATTDRSTSTFASRLVLCMVVTWVFGCTASMTATDPEGADGSRPSASADGGRSPGPGSDAAVDGGRGNPDDGGTGTLDDGGPTPEPTDAGDVPEPPDAASPPAGSDAGSGAPPSVCGNGVVEPGEVCDDGNTVDVDLCNARCDASRPPPPPIQAVFSQPDGASGCMMAASCVPRASLPPGEACQPCDSAMQDEIHRLLQMVPPGGVVRVVMYDWTHARFANWLGDAARRPADVQVIVDGTQPTSTVMTALRTQLGSGNVHPCPSRDGSACIGSFINHNKIFLFSHLTDGSRFVVVQSSANLNQGQLVKHNNLVVIRGDEALYDAYSNYWNDLRAANRNDDYYRIRDGAEGTRAYFFPRAAGDTIVSVLDNVDCTGGGTIRVGMALFSDERITIARRLDSLARAGCDVRVVLGEGRDSGPEPSPGDRVGQCLDGSLYGSAGARLCWGVPHRIAGVSSPGLHSKYLLIDARYNASANRRQLVFTGSHNFTGRALRENDEAMLRLEDPAVYRAFFDNWGAIWAQIR